MKSEWRIACRVGQSPGDDVFSVRSRDATSSRAVMRPVGRAPQHVVSWLAVRALARRRRVDACGPALQRLAQRSACSSRSLPQNNSPSAVVKLGAPGRRRWRLGLRPQPRLDRIRLGGFEHRRRLDLQFRQDVGDGRHIVDAAPAAELRAEDRATEILAPAVIERGQRGARGEQLCCGNGSGRRNGKDNSAHSRSRSRHMWRPLAGRD